MSQPEDIHVWVHASDSHCGSLYGLCPPEVYTTDGSAYIANVIQRHTWEKFEKATGLRWEKYDDADDKPQRGEIFIDKGELLSDLEARIRGLNIHPLKFMMHDKSRRIKDALATNKFLSRLHRMLSRS